ncbi:MAG TPA: hypothetical protein VF147_07625 [Vicinamibacterales bacterium]
MRPLVSLALALLASVSSLPQGARPPRVEVLRSIGGLPAHLAGAIEEISACHLSSQGNYLIFDRRLHAVYTAAPDADAPRRIVQIGAEAGRILRPSAFDSDPASGSFVVADSPGGRPRFQFFFDTGGSAGGFMLPGPEVPQITMGDIVLSGIGSVKYTGHSLLVSQPQLGALVTEYAITGETLRTFGELRPTGQEKDRDVHVALNAGIALSNPDGGFYFVFMSGVPMFRKYDAQGRLVFERHVEGIELDQYVRGIPTTWPKRKVGGDELPIVPATVRTAAVDPDGNLWISLAMPYTYVYDRSGDKKRTVQFAGAGVQPASGLFFTRDKRVLVTPGCYLFNRQP